MIGGLNHARQASARWRCFADWTDRIAAGEVPPAPPRPQGLERNVVITHVGLGRPEGLPARRRRRPTAAIPTVNANGPLYGALELSADYLPVLDPVRHTASQVPLTVRDPNTPPTSPNDAGAVALLGRRSRSGRARTTSTTRCSMSRAASGSPPPCVRPTTRTYCKARIDPSVGEAVPARARRPPPRDVRSEDREAHAHQHVLRHASPDVCRGRQQHAVDERRRPGGRLAEHEDVRGDRRRREVAGLDGAHHRHQRQRQARRVRRAEPAGRSDEGQALSAARSTRVAPAPDGSVWGSQLGFPGRGHPARARIEPAGDGAGGGLRAAVRTIRSRVQGFSPRGMDVDRNGVAWAALASGHMASFDRRKCKGPLNGPNATGQHCPEGWTLLPRAAAADEGRDRLRERRRQLLHVGRSVRHARPRRATCRSTPATRPKGCWH